MCAQRRLKRQEAAENSLCEIRQLLEERMEQVCLSEAEKNACTEALIESVKKMRAASAGDPTE